MWHVRHRLWDCSVVRAEPQGGLVVKRTTAKEASLAHASSRPCWRALSRGPPAAAGGNTLLGPQIVPGDPKRNDGGGWRWPCNR